jgi:hypothetical protein
MTKTKGINPNYPIVKAILEDIKQPNKSDPILAKLHETIEIENIDQKDPKETLTEEQKDKLKRYYDLDVDKLPNNWKQLLERIKILEEEIKRLKEKKGKGDCEELKKEVERLEKILISRNSRNNFNNDNHKKESKVCEI